jgi:NAD(P)-dependent dehydrogenase (short-subunit alcohol dehydrogenase family)
MMPVREVIHMTEFNGKVVLITGAGLSLGRALVAAFADQGARLALNDLMATNIETQEEGINAAGGEARHYALDVSKKLTVQALVNQVEDDFGAIDILINHASVQPHNPALDMDEWDWRRVTDVILTGTFLMSQSVGRVMRQASKGGVILNIGPSAGTAQRSAYLAAKAGVLAWTEAAAPEFAEHNIYLNALVPDRDNLTASVAQALAICAGTESGRIFRL